VAHERKLQQQNPSPRQTSTNAPFRRLPIAVCRNCGISTVRSEEIAPTMNITRFEAAKLPVLEQAQGQQ